MLRVYFWGIFVVMAGLVLTLFLPQLALRTSNARAGVSAGKAGAQEAEAADAARLRGESGQPIAAGSEE